MKHKYLISKDNETKILILKEYAELDKDIMKFVCEESYDDKKIQSAISKGKEALVSTLRTVNFYPSGFYANKLAEAVMEYYHNKSAESVEIFFNDAETIPKEKVKEITPTEDIVSPTICQKAALIFRLPRLAFLSSSIPVRLASKPIPAISNISGA